MNRQTQGLEHVETSLQRRLMNASDVAVAGVLIAASPVIMFVGERVEDFEMDLRMGTDNACVCVCVCVCVQHVSHTHTHTHTHTACW